MDISKGNKGEDGDELDVLVGTGDINGYIKVYRYNIDVPGTKMIFSVTQPEWKEVVSAFSPVVREEKKFSSENEKDAFIETFLIT